MRLGAGRAEIHFSDDFFPSEGFAKVVHPLYVRAMILGDEAPVVLLSVEMTSMPDDETEQLRALVLHTVDTREENVWVSVTHTFSAPHFMPDFQLKSDEERAHKVQLREIVHAAAKQALTEAKADRQEVVLEAAQGESHVHASRDIELADGWWVGCGGEGPVDRTLTVLRAREQGRTKAILFHLPVQSSVLDGSELQAGGKAVSSDLAGLASAGLEARFPGTVAMFMVGAAGDAAPIRKAKGFMPDGSGGYAEADLQDEGIAICEQLGKQLADETAAMIESGAFKAIEGVPSVRRRTFMAPAKQMNRNLRELKPCRSYPYTPDGEKEQTIEALFIGDWAILGVRPELCCVTAQRIRQNSPVAHTLVATMVNGGAKYMADRSAYERVMYEAINSPFAPGAAELLEEQANILLSKI